MNAFDTRLLNDLFPEMPESFDRRVHKTLDAIGAKQKTVRPLHIASAAVAAAVAASFLLVLTSALRDQPQHAVSPDRTAPSAVIGETPDQTNLPAASAEPRWSGNTAILSAVPEEGHYSEQDVNRFGRCILSFLHSFGESEPEELWVVAVRSAESEESTDGASVLVLAQYRFDAHAGPDLFCIQSHPDGEVLWGTIDGAPGPHRVLAQVGGRQQWVLFGSNTLANGESIGHISAGYLTGGAPGTDVEFSAILSTDAAREAFRTSRYARQLPEYYLVKDGGTDPDAVLDRSLMLVSSDTNVAFPIRDSVMEMECLTAQEAKAIRAHIDAIAAATEEPYVPPTPTAGATVVNLTDLNDASAMPYTDAVLAWLRSRHDGVEPDTLWLCAVAPFAFPEEAPTDEAYVLAQYGFNGETGPELFFVKDGTVLWQTFGYDPFRINTVYDPIKDQNAVFGASPYFDNGPVSVKEAKLTLESEDGSVSRAIQDDVGFWMELPLADVNTRLNGRQTEWAREFFICPYPKNMKIVQISFTAQNEEVYYPDVKTVNHLDAHTAQDQNP